MYNHISFLGGWIAQSVEQQTENLRVGSSILPLTTISFKILILSVFLSFKVCLDTILGAIYKIELKLNFLLLF